MSFPISSATPVTYAGPPPQSADVAVVGGGIIGVCTALFLARAGQRVVLCEKGRIAGEQSSRNWGWIRQQGRDADELPIMVEANRLWRQLDRETNVDIGLRQNGCTYIAATEAEFRRFQTWLPLAHAEGVDTKLLGRKETAAMMPDAARSVFGAMHTASDLRAEPWVAVPALAGIAARDGAVLIEDCAVRALDIEAGAITGVVTEQGRIKAPQVVVAGGAWSALLLRRHGVDIPQLSVRSSVCATAPLPDVGSAGTNEARLAYRRREDGGYTLAPGGASEIYVGPDAVRALPDYLTQLKADPLGVQLRLSAPKGFPDSWLLSRRWAPKDQSPFERMRVLNPDPNMKRLRKAVAAFSDLFPNLGPVRIAKAWAGMIDTMPDFVPVVDRATRLPGLIIGTGMSGHGFGIGPGMGRVLADLTPGKQVGHDLKRFRLSPFTDGTPLILAPHL